MSIAALTVALAATAAAIGPRQLYFWLHWAIRASIVVVLLDLIITYAISMLGVLAVAHSGWQVGGSPLLNDLVAATLAQFLARRPKDEQATTITLAFGLIPFVHELAAVHVSHSVDRWLGGVCLDTDKLLDLSSLLDTGRPMNSSLALRRRWRDEAAVAAKSPDDQVRREAINGIRDAIRQTIVSRRWTRP